MICPPSLTNNYSNQLWTHFCTAWSHLPFAIYFHCFSLFMRALFSYWGCFYVCIVLLLINQRSELLVSVPKYCFWATRIFIRYFHFIGFLVFLYFYVLCLVFMFSFQYGVICVLFTILYPTKRATSLGAKIPFHGLFYLLISFAFLYFLIHLFICGNSNLSEPYCRCQNWCTIHCMYVHCMSVWFVYYVTFVIIYLFIYCVSLRAISVTNWCSNSIFTCFIYLFFVRATLVPNVSFSQLFSHFFMFSVLLGGYNFRVSV